MRVLCTEERRLQQRFECSWQLHGPSHAALRSIDVRNSLILFFKRGSPVFQPLSFTTGGFCSREAHFANLFIILAMSRSLTMLMFEGRGFTQGSTYLFSIIYKMKCAFTWVRFFFTFDLRDSPKKRVLVSVPTKPKSRSTTL